MSAVEALLAALALGASGYAICAALFPPGALEEEERWAYSFVFAISAAALGGLLVQLFFDLGRGAWVAIAVATTLGAAAVAWRRRGWRRPSARKAARRLPAGALWALGFGAAAAIACGAVAIATSGVREQHSRQRFASLWAVPHGERVEAGVWNHGGPARYELAVSSAGKPVERLQLHLGPDQHWSALLGPGVSVLSGETTIVLYHGRLAYRSVALNPVGGG